MVTPACRRQDGREGSRAGERRRPAGGRGATTLAPAGALARPALGVAADLPVAEAVRRANEVGARGLVVVGGDGAPLGVVSEAAVAATPQDRRPWIAVGTLARSVDRHALLDPDLSGEQLLEAMRASPAPEHVVRDGAGHLGVLLTEDVAKAVAAR